MRLTRSRQRSSGHSALACAVAGPLTAGITAVPAIIFGMLAERLGHRGSQATWSPALPIPAAVPVGYGPCAESPLLICSGG